jgi:hypothetical protein
MVAAVGGVFLALGLASGLMLLLTPLRVGAMPPSDVVWVLFPLLTLTGYLLLGMAAGLPSVQIVSRVAAAALLLLAVLAAGGLLYVSSAPSIEPVNLTPLWFVLGVGLMVGLAGLTLPVFRRPMA